MKSKMPQARQVENLIIVVLERARLDKYSEDKHCIILAGMEIYPDDAPKLYNFLLEFYSSYSDVHKLSESDYTNSIY